MLEIIKLEKNYGKIKALDRVSLRLKKGEIFGIIGQNGAGKTTLLRILAGLLSEDQGEILWNGQQIEEIPDYRYKIGYVPYRYQLYENLKVREYLEFYAGLYHLNRKEKRKRISTVLSMVNLTEEENTYVENLSQGMGRRLCVARALVHDPEILIMDEPMNGLDPKARIEFQDILSGLCSRERTILISSQMVSGLPSYCTSMGILEKGRMILEGTMEEIMRELKQNQPIVIEVMGDTEEAVRILKANACVKKITLDGNQLLILFEGEEEQETELLRELVQAKVRVHKFCRDKGDLESRFLDLIS